MDLNRLFGIMPYVHMNFLQIRVVAFIGIDLINFLVIPIVNCSLVDFEFLSNYVITFN